MLPYDYVTYGQELTDYLKTASAKPAAHGLDFAFALAAAARFTQAATDIRSQQLHPPANPAALNLALRSVETAFLSSSGLPNRPWYKHAIYAPGEFTGYAAVDIPGVNEALDANNPTTAAQQLTILTNAINLAATNLESAR
uniref:Glutamate carboxypeptidase II n=1 Tax=mine drainage metagenome TaxID=410659 RepID=E6QN78_9ZZZZ